jgi:hypothetical protein
MGAYCRWWMPLCPPFSMVGKQFAKNMSSCRNILSTLLIYKIKQNPASMPSVNPCGWPPTRRIGALTMVMVFVWGVVSVLDGTPLLFLL